jgi:hypothetical protein
MCIWGQCACHLNPEADNSAWTLRPASVGKDVLKSGELRLSAHARKPAEGGSLHVNRRSLAFPTTSGDQGSRLLLIGGSQGCWRCSEEQKS